jgi:beta-glucosidase-like glycosyl hydrolase
MKAVSSTTETAEATVRAIQAGCDAVLLCNSTPDDQWRAVETLIHAVERGEIPRARFDDALARQQQTKARFSASMAAPVTGVNLDPVGRAEHLAIAREMSAWR